ncbi:LysM peptidoglycan-binding domain-containing protein [Nanchangia anserum]|uniref:LysM peptidoglycan-binding domain-containing protein n=2 Tax=Nanchangia anserum TaxID=2692125 RepID=A0A8I0KQJ8_9ACTO|nr:LysM peptidoglycan-binding domain-containing protein [Nanchangia anserum]QOX82557.1 LysM peptidoglycan-binding domain-containing protein [Nanchangia anserum]
MLRLGAPVVRRAILGTTSLALIPGLAIATPALADDGSDSSVSPDLTDIPADLGWAAPTEDSADPVPKTTSPPPPAPDPPPERDTEEAEGAQPVTPPSPPLPETPATPASPAAVPSTPAPAPSAASPQTLPAVPMDVGWGAIRLSTPTPPAQPETPAATAGVDDTYVVAPGDSLWSIAADSLPPGASPATIDRAWRALYRGNADKITSPDLIHPGLTLTLEPLRELS